MNKGIRYIGYLCDVGGWVDGWMGGLVGGWMDDVAY
jgi:hypothetical protein